MLPPCTRDPEGLALLMACKENPLDLAPRLILTDWLEDHGEEDVARCLRESMAGDGSLVPLPTHVQERWYPLNGCDHGWFCLRPEAETVERKLDELRDCPWLGSMSLEELPAALARHIADAHATFEQVVSLTTEGGWKSDNSWPHVSHAFTNLADLTLRSKLLDDSDALALCGDRRVSRLQSLSLGISHLQSETFQAITNASWLPNLRSLMLFVGRHDASCARVLKSKLLENMESLTIDNSFRSEEVIKALTGNDRFPRLKRLGFRRMPLTPHACQTLLNGFNHQRLESLILEGLIDFGDDGLKVIAKWPGLVWLKCLRLCRNSCGWAGLTSLVTSSAAAGIEELDLSSNRFADVEHEPDPANVRMRNLNILNLAYCELTEREAGGLLNALAKRRMKVLDLSWNRIGETGIRSLVDLSNWSAADLNLSRNFLSEQGLQHLAESPLLQSVEQLDVSHNGIEAFGIEALAKSSHVNSLKSLNLSMNPFGDKGLAWLASGSWLSNLKELDVGESGVTDEGLLSLLNSPHLGELQSLGLWANAITDRGADAIARCEALQSLTDLYIQSKHLTDKGRKALRNSPYLRHTIIH